MSVYIEPLESNTLNERDLRLESLDLLNKEEIRFIKTMDKNIQDLNKIQLLYLMEENITLSLEEVLSRVLSFYQRYVPYKYRY
jgi:hypothetical protein